jgi:hypothetical protein
MSKKNESPPERDAESPSEDSEAGAPERPREAPVKQGSANYLLLIFILPVVLLIVWQLFFDQPR